MDNQKATAVHMPGLYTTGFIVGLGTGLLSTVALVFIGLGWLSATVASLAWGIAMGYALWRHRLLRKYEKQFLTEVAHDRLIMMAIAPHLEKAMGKVKGEVVPENKELH